MHSGQTRRRFLIAVAVTTLAGCQQQSPAAGEQTPTTTSASNPAMGDVSQRGDLRLTSPAFDDGGAIPIKYGRNAANVDPPLSISGVPTWQRRSS
jgi:hypothetical protein